MRRKGRRKERKGGRRRERGKAGRGKDERSRRSVDMDKCRYSTSQFISTHLC